MKRIIISALYLLVLFSVSHFIFDPAHLYFEVKWLDIPMHILGGIGVASLTSAVLTYFGRRVFFWRIVFVYSVVAIAWELYEYTRDVATLEGWSGWPDTIKDYIDGLLGVSLMYHVLRN